MDDSLESSSYVASSARYSSAPSHANEDSKNKKAKGLSQFHKQVSTLEVNSFFDQDEEEQRNQMADENINVDTGKDPNQIITPNMSSQANNSRLQHQNSQGNTQLVSL